MLIDRDDVVVDEPPAPGWAWTPSWDGRRSIGVLEAGLVGRWDFVPNIVVSLWDESPEVQEMWDHRSPDFLAEEDVLLAEARADGRGVPPGDVVERLTARAVGSGDMVHQLTLWHAGRGGSRRLQVVGSALVGQSAVVAQSVWDVARAIRIRGEE